MSSKWVRLVAAERDHDVEWRLTSLRLVNAEVTIDGCISVPRGSDIRAPMMIAINRDHPVSVDRVLAGRKGAVEEAVAGHSSL